MKAASETFLLIFFMLAAFIVSGQEHTLPVDRIKLNDTALGKHYSPQTDKNGQLDIIDVGISIGKSFLKKVPKRGVDTGKADVGKAHISLLPGVGYSLQTGFAAVIQGNCGFYTSNTPDANLSSIESSISYTQLQQILIPIQANLWSKNNAYNLQTDWRFLKFPQMTYGIGGYTSLQEGYFIDYSNIRMYTTLYKAVAPDVYVGAGYDFDYLWDVHEVNPPPGVVTDFQKYGISNTDVASAPTIDFLYDTRRNSINPAGGSFVNLVYRPNLTLIGSSENWQSLVLDMRKYIPLPFGSKNILALWSYDWLTVDGHPPYVLLPNTGGDPYGNTGRGFTEGRFRGRDMLYAESEYRFGITKNGFLGGVVFVNGQSFSEETNDQFARIYAGYGAGLRIKFNKFSKTNICLDYAFGSDGSKGVFINLGEVF